MPVQERIAEAIFAAIDEINEQLPAELQLTRTTDTVLFGESGALDSLGLVNLIVATEEQLEVQLEVSLTLASEKAMSQKNSPFRTVKSLTEYIAQLMEEPVL